VFSLADAGLSARHWPPERRAAGDGGLLRAGACYRIFCPAATLLLSIDVTDRRTL